MVRFKTRFHGNIIVFSKFFGPAMHIEQCLIVYSPRHFLKVKFYNKITPLNYTAETYVNVTWQCTLGFHFPDKKQTEFSHKVKAAVKHVGM